MSKYISCLFFVTWDLTVDWFKEEFMDKVFSTTINPNEIRITKINHCTDLNKAIVSIIGIKENDIKVCLQFFFGLQDMTFTHVSYLSTVLPRHIHDYFDREAQTFIIAKQSIKFDSINIKSSENVQCYSFKNHEQNYIPLMKSDVVTHINFLKKCCEWRKHLNITKLKYPINPQLNVLMRNVKYLKNQNPNNTILNINYQNIILNPVCQINLVTLMLLQKVHQMVNPQRVCSQWSKYMNKFIVIFEHISDIITMVINKILSDKNKIMCISDITAYNYNEILSMYL